MRLQVKKLNEKAIVPKYHSEGASAFDLHACLDRWIAIIPGTTVAIPTGLALYVKDPNYGLFVWERSGLGKKGIQVRGGVVDSDYQGEIFVMLTNGSHLPFNVEPGDRIAQAVLAPVFKAEFEVVDEFDSATERGENRFGSTGR
jgi:dUTP pyrophosphatase